MSSKVEDLSEKPIFALEEQLARQKGILLNGNLIRKLPDKGAKLKDSVAKLETELERRKKELASKEAMKNVPDVEKLEWDLRATSLSTSSNGRSQGKGCSNEELDSDDDDEPVKEEEEPKNSEDVLRIIATSQITQREVKPSIDGSARIKKNASNSSVRKEVKRDPYLAKLVERDVRTSLKESKKFLAHKSLKPKLPGSSSPATSASSTEGSSSNSKGKWDEALLPLKSDYDGVRMMSMEDTIQVSCDKYKHAEELKATAPPKKTYAYDKLREQGIVDACTVEMQVSRPLPADLDDDDENFNEEDDLSHDSITEESESDISDNEDENHKDKKSKARDKTSKDLSGLLNASLKMS